MFPGSRGWWRNDGSLKQFFVYIVSNNSMTLYTGVTTNLEKRVNDHKSGIGCAFTQRYHFDRLVYFEVIDDADDAFRREKQIKGWTRAKKIALVKSLNPQWHDLASPSS
jgi:putative endonuclease